MMIVRRLAQLLVDLALIAAVSAGILALPWRVAGLVPEIEVGRE
jgi:hypothetical protein